jgi:hypothetical protein
MAGLPHFRNSKASMAKYEPLYIAQFEVLLTPPPAVGGWDLVMEQVLKVDGIAINKMPALVEQKYKSARRSFAGGSIAGDTSVDLSLDFEINLDDNNSAYVYKALRKWCDLIYDPLTGRMGLKRDYMGGPMIVNFFNKAGDIYRQVRFAQVFPMVALPMPANADFNDNEIFRITGFQLRADYWEETIL